MECPRLSEYDDVFRLRRQKALYVYVFRARNIFSARRAESAELCVCKRRFFYFLKEFHIFRIRAGIPRFDIRDTEFVERVHDVNFILNRKTDPFALYAVAQCRVEDIDRSV